MSRSFQSFPPNLSDFWISCFSQAFQDQILGSKQGDFNPVEKYMLPKLDHLPSYRGKNTKHLSCISPEK